MVAMIVLLADELLFISEERGLGDIGEIAYLLLSRTSESDMHEKGYFCFTNLPYILRTIYKLSVRSAGVYLVVI